MDDLEAQLLEQPPLPPDWEERIDYMDDVDFFRSDPPSLAGQLWASRTQHLPWYNTISEPGCEVPSNFMEEEDSHARSVSTDFADSVITDFSESVEDEPPLEPERPAGPGSSPTHSIDTLLDLERPDGPGSPTHSIDTLLDLERPDGPGSPTHSIDTLLDLEGPDGPGSPTHSIDTLLDRERPTGPGSPTHSIDTLPDEDVCYVVLRDKAVSLLPVTTPRAKVVPKRKKYCCEECGKAYTHRSGLSRHKNIHLERFHECPKCDAKLTRSDSLTDHMRRHHKV